VRSRLAGAAQAEGQAMIDSRGYIRRANRCRLLARPLAFRGARSQARSIGPARRETRGSLCDRCSRDRSRQLLRRRPPSLGCCLRLLQSRGRSVRFSRGNVGSV
jgi:hypothetical protein